MVGSRDGSRHEFGPKGAHGDVAQAGPGSGEGGGSPGQRDGTWWGVTGAPANGAGAAERAGDLVGAFSRLASECFSALSSSVLSLLFYITNSIPPSLSAIISYSILLTTLMSVITDSSSPIPSEQTPRHHRLPIVYNQHVKNLGSLLTNMVELTTADKTWPLKELRRMVNKGLHGDRDNGKNNDDDDQCFVPTSDVKIDLT